MAVVMMMAIVMVMEKVMKKRLRLVSHLGFLSVGRRLWS